MPDAQPPAQHGIPFLSSSRLRARLRSMEFGQASKWVVLGSLVGFLGGLAGAALHWLIGAVATWSLRRPLGLAGEGLDGFSPRWWLLLAVPVLGGLVTGVLVAYVSPESSGHGTDSVIDAFHRGRGWMRKRVIALKAVTSAITIGSGGSAGQEGPIAQVCSGIGCTVAARLRLRESDRRLLLLAGASAGIGAMFRSPLGGALFMPEVLYSKSEFEGAAIVPCIISSIIAYATFTAIGGGERAIELSPEIQRALTFDQPLQLLVYLVLALLCVVVGRIYTKAFYGLHDGMRAIKRVPMSLKPAIGGLLLGVTALSIAPLAGTNGVLFGGYGLIHSAIDGHLTVKVMLVLLVAKAAATCFSVGSGGSGGVFAPSLAIGALLGSVVGVLAQRWLPGLEVNPACFALVGMGGFFAGVAKVPVTSVVIVSEMTGGYELLAPLMFVAVLHQLLSKGSSLYRAQVPGILDSPAHAGEFVVDVLEQIRVRELLAEARPPLSIPHDATLRQVLRTIADAHASYFPVVDDEGHMIGIFSLTDLRRIYLEPGVEDLVIASDFMIEDVITATAEDRLDEVQRRMIAHEINSIPIVDQAGNGRVVALLERNDIARGYTLRLRQMKGAVAS